MKRNSSILIAGILVGIVVVVAIVFMIINSKQQSSQNNGNAGMSESQASQTEQQSANSASIKEVIMQNRSFSPKTLTVKKGTTVRWTNQDTMGHNVVSDTNAPAGGPPKQASLLNKGETFEFTFDTVGSFAYHCAPHPDMTGTIEVVE